MKTVVPRRTVVVATGVALAGAGCLGSWGDESVEESGNVNHPDEARHEIEASEGDTLRIDVTNEDGVATVVNVRDPEYDVVIDTEVESEATLTHDVDLDGTHRVRISPFGEASYEISVE